MLEPLFDFKDSLNRIALIEGERSLSYAELDGLSARIAAPCEARSVAFVFCTNCIESVAGYVGFINHGVVPLLLESGIDGELLASLLEAYRPRYAWAPAKDAGRVGEGTELLQEGGYTLYELSEGIACALDEDLGLLMSTSGSTGSPKLVRQTYTNLAANTSSIVEYLGITESERAITSLPMNYVYGLSVINTHLWAGATLILTNLACYSKGFWKLFREQEATSFAGVPFMYEMLEKLRFTTKMELPTLRTMTQAGGKLAPDLQDRFARYAADHGVNFVVMYGASEATARMGYLPAEHALDKRGSMGIPIPGGKFEIVDVDGKPIDEPNVAGELVYYGPNVTLGYALCADDLAKGDENHGRLATGDVAQRDEDGFYYIVGRLKRFVKIVGRRTNLDEMERLLVRRFGTLDIACAGHDDLLAVFLTDESIAHDVVEYVYGATEINRRMIAVRVVDEIPKSGSGKTLYGKLNSLLEEEGK